MSAAQSQSPGMRGARGLRSFLKSAGAGRGARGGSTPSGERRDFLDRRVPDRRPDRPPGVEIAALGPRSRAVFAATARVASEWSAAADLVVADTPAEAREADCPVVALSQAPPRLRVPAFDPSIDNPVGWRREMEHQVGTLGPLKRLPAGVTADRILPRRPDRVALHALHHVEDVAACHTDIFERAGELARLAANGAVVHLADGGPGLEPLLGEELHALMTGDLRDLDPDAREWLSIRMRRLAHRDHSLRARARQFAEEAALSDPIRLPRVSILLPTRRPSFLAHALGSVARQNWPELELVLALHGDGFDAGEVERRANELPCPVKVVRMDGSRPFGTLLNEAAEAASGWLLTKMDDDDLYDADHVRDLVLAYEYSEAEVVGRVAQFFWLGNVERTVRLWPDSGERYSTGALVSGGTLLFPRRMFDAAGGWQRVSGGEDKQLLQDVQWQGGSIYQMHGAGYVVARHSVDHAWEEEESRLESLAVAARDGWAPEFACMDRNLPLPPTARNGSGRDAPSGTRAPVSAPVPPPPRAGDRDDAGAQSGEGVRCAVTLEAGYVPAARVVQVVERLLAEDVSGLAIRLETSLEEAGLGTLRDRLPPEPRVRIVTPAQSGGPARAPGRRDPRLGMFLERTLDEFPEAPFHVVLPARVDLRPDLIARLQAYLGDAAAASCPLPGGMSVAIARGPALHRARHAGGSVVDFGARRPLFSHCLLTPPSSSAAGEERRTNDAGTGRAFHRRLRGWAANRVRHVAGRRRRRSDGGPPGRGAAASSSRHTDDALGVELAVLGARSRAVFGATARVAHELREGTHADVAVADTPEEAAGAGVPLVALSEAPARFSVPAFDPCVDNPVNWNYRAGEEVGALGPIEWLPRGAGAHRVLPRRPGKAALRSLHHVEDVAAYHVDALARAGELARLAANGAVVHLADGGPGLEPLLGEELHALMATDARDLDPGAREWLSIRMRRLALRDHSRRARARQLSETALSDPPREPLVSVLTGTYRPEFLAHALASVARQTWPRLELILALHGDGFDPGEVEQRVRELKCPVKVVRVDRSHGLGGVLNFATAAASGPILTLIDDDDLYDAEHIRDLMLAYEYSGAALVGRLVQCVWLRRSGRTVRLWNAGGERYLPHPGGSTLLFSRQTLEEAGGWNRNRPDVDRALFRKIESIGGTIYQCHGAGFTLVRHGIDHAWDAPDAEILKRAEAVSDGWDPALARFETDIPLPVPARRGIGNVSP